MHDEVAGVDFFKKFFNLGRRTGTIQKAIIVDIDPLLTSVTPEHPSGEKDLEYDPEFIKLEEKLGGTPEKEIGGKIVQEAKGPNWNEIQQEATDLLTRTHDLRVAIAFTRALLNTEGLIGLGVGLSLLNCLIERFWDTLYPRLPPEDDYDPTQRINILMTLCDREAILEPLRGAVLCISPTRGRCTLRDIQKATSKLPASSVQASMEAVFADCDLDALQANREVAEESLLRLNSLEEILGNKIREKVRTDRSEKVGTDHAPHFEELRQVLSEIENVLGRQISQHASSALSAPPNKIEAPSSEANSTAPSISSASIQREDSMDTINSRQDVTRILEQICRYYEKNEPASPVPLLLKRAARLVDKNFFEIIQDMAPESVTQIQKLIDGSKEK